MYPRVEYEMSEADEKRLLEAMRPVPVMFLSGGIPMGGDPQENANRAWADLGGRMGFDHMTVRPVGDKGQRFFTAVPSETAEARAVREVQEAAERRAAELAEIHRKVGALETRRRELEDEAVAASLATLPATTGAK